MANEAHVEVVLGGSADIAAWRNEHGTEAFDLRGADLSYAELQTADLHRADLRGADLSNASLRRVDLTDADLHGAVLTWADLTEAILVRAQLSEADLSMADLTGASIPRADLNWANLARANFDTADLTLATLRGADLGGSHLVAATLNFSDLREANLHQSRIGGTSLAGTLLTASGLETIEYWGPSQLDHSTLEASGMLPIAFLRGCGLPDHLIQYYQSVYDQPIQRYSCFISYSTTDQSLADRLHADLDVRGVRNWLATEDLKIGDRHRQVIEDQIRLHDKLLLILSEHSVASRWVEREVLAALDREDRTGDTVLFPIHIDNAVFETQVQWASEIQRGRHIGDFTGWNSDNERYVAALDRVLRDLQPSGAQF